MKKVKIIVFAVVALFMGTAILTSINGTGIDANYVCIETAAKAAEAKIAELGKSDDFSICGESAIYDNGRALFYIFHLQPRGYVVTSANLALPPVIAYSFTSDFSGGQNVLIDMLKADITLRIKNIQNLPSDIIESRKQMWKGMLNPKNVYKAEINFEQWPPDGTTSTGGWLETTWSQDAP